MNRGIPLVALVLAVSISACDKPTKHINVAGASGNTATLRLTRESRLHSVAISYDVILNEAKVETVGDGKTLVVQFEPRPGKQVLRLSCTGLGGHQMESDPVFFDASPAGTYYFKCYTAVSTGKELEKGINTGVSIVLNQVQ